VVILIQPGSEAAQDLQCSGCRALQARIKNLRLPLAEQGGKVLSEVDGFGYLGMLLP
jgi:hypothetical protein